MKKALFLTGIYWDETYQRHQQFAEYLAQNGYKVFFVEHIVSSKFQFNTLFERILNNVKVVVRKDDFVKESKKKNSNIITISPRFLFPGNGLLLLYNKFNIRRMLDKTGTDFDIVFNYLPINTTRYILDSIDYKKLIYDCVRNFKGWGTYYKSIEDEEQRLIKRADYVLADSYFLSDMLNEKAPNKAVVQFLPIANNDWLSGCNSNRIPETIRSIGYFGTVSYHIDQKILKTLSENGLKIHIWGLVCSNMNFDYIDHGFETDLKLLSSQITEYCDAIILPYHGNMDGVIPAKMIQSLSTMLPVFISDFYDARRLSDYVYLYKDSNEVLAEIKSYNTLLHRNKMLKIRGFIKDLTEEKQRVRFLNLIS